MPLLAQMALVVSVEQEQHQLLVKPVVLEPVVDQERLVAQVATVATESQVETVAQVAHHSKLTVQLVLL
jgi:hypothetical protein